MSRMRKTYLVAHKGGQVARGFGIVLGEGTNATKVVSGSLSGVELQRSATRMFEFTVRHGLNE